MMNVGFIYCITCLTNGKMYIGQTSKTIEKRWKQHLSTTERGSNHEFHQAIRKYGKKNFVVEEVMFVEAPNKHSLKRKLDFLERHFIARYDTRRNGYNSTDGGDMSHMLGKHHSIETRIRIGIAGKGRTHSEETKRKIARGNKGKKVSEETCRKISKAKKGKVSTFKGKHLSKETRQYLSKIAMGRPSPFKGRHHTEETKRKLREMKLL